MVVPGRVRCRCRGNGAAAGDVEIDHTAPLAVWTQLCSEGVLTSVWAMAMVSFKLMLAS